MSKIGHLLRVKAICREKIGPDGRYLYVLRKAVIDPGYVISAQEFQHPDHGRCTRLCFIEGHEMSVLGTIQELFEDADAD